MRNFIGGLSAQRQVQHGVLAAVKTPHPACAVLIMQNHAAAVSRGTTAGAEGIKVTPDWRQLTAHACSGTGAGHSETLKP
jgi:hypothetical protein